MSVIDHVPEALPRSSICASRRDRVKAGDNCKALVKCRRLVPLGPLSHSWHPAQSGRLQHAWGVLSHAVPLIHCRRHIMSRSLRASKLKRLSFVWKPKINKSTKQKGKGGQRAHAALAFPSVWSCQSLSLGMIALT